MREKVVLHKDPVEVTYDQERWDLFKELRARTADLQVFLDVQAHVYGSVARGDVKRTSDIDLIILDDIPSYKIELGLGEEGFDLISREIVKANPNSVPKGHIQIDERTMISFFLGPRTISEEEFYRFGGLVEAGSSGRAPGIDKRLLFIEPTDEGHIESGIGGREAEVARSLGIGTEIVNERIRVLTRRDRVGRTGVYLKRRLHDGEGFEEVLKQIADRDYITRRQIRG